jgi:hypothetical protein
MMSPKVPALNTAVIGSAVAAILCLGLVVGACASPRVGIIVVGLLGFGFSLCVCIACGPVDFDRGKADP